MPQQQQTTVQQQQRQRSPLAGIFQAVTGIASAFLPPPAGAAANFLAGAVTGNGQQMGSAATSAAKMMQGGGEAGTQPPPKEEPTDENQLSPQPPQQQQEGFVGPQVEQAGPAEQIPGQMSGNPEDQKAMQEKIFGMIEQSSPDLPFMVQSNPQLIPGLQNFLSNAEARWMNQRNQGGGQ